MAMGKFFKLGLSIFVGLDIFAFSYMGLAQLRFSLFGSGAIPGGGSALDMALFLIPLFIGYLAGDRLFHFLNYKERKEKAQLKPIHSTKTFPEPEVWIERGWEDGEEAEKAGLNSSPSSLSRPKNQE